jgi:hypothetical protein
MEFNEHGGQSPMWTTVLVQRRPGARVGHGSASLRWAGVRRDGGVLSTTAYDPDISCVTDTTIFAPVTTTPSCYRRVSRTLPTEAFPCITVRTRQSPRWS